MLRFLLASSIPNSNNNLIIGSYVKRHMKDLENRDMKTMIVVMAMVIAVTARAQKTNALDTLRQSMEMQQLAGLTQYGKALDSILAEMKAKGDLDNYLVIQTEQKRFEAEKSVPQPTDAPESFRSASKAYYKKRVALLEHYVKALDQLIKKEVMASRIDEAKAAKAEKDQVSVLLADMQSTIPAKEEPVSPPESRQLPPPSKKVNDGRVLHFSFDNNEGDQCTDASGKGNNGNVQGSTWVRQGHHGGGMKFDGVDDQILVPNNTSLDLTSVTLSAWICPENIEKGNNMIMEKRPHDGCWELMHYDLGRLLVRGSSSQTEGSERKTIKAGKWVHVVATISGAEGHIYLDGKKIKTTPVTPLRVTSGDVLIGAGRSWSLSDDQFTGLMDDVMIFNRALSASEIQQLYNSQK